MNRLEALHILGLGEDATPEEIKTAYRECAQILHPDKFATNKKLQTRATEQFKNLKEAYEYLISGKGAKRSRTTGSTSGSSRTGGAAGNASRDAEARLAGIAAARAQLVAQRDVIADERRNGMIMAAAGAAIAFITLRRPFGLFGLVGAIASTACVWGIVQVISANKTLDTLNDHLRKLNSEKKKLIEELEEIE